MKDLQAPADWQLPAGVNRGLWDYLHDSALAAGYDASLEGVPLLQVDRDFVIEHCQPAGRLVDLGCGTGRLLIPLAERGYWVVGVDLSEPMLRVAEAKARAAGVSVQLLQANIVQLDGLASGTFDHATCLFSTLGMVVGEAQRAEVLRQVFRLLRPGGRFVVHVHNRWFHLRSRGGRRWLVRDSLRRLAGEAGGDHRMPVHQGIAGLTLHLYTRQELGQKLAEAGFHVDTIRPISLEADGRLRWPHLLSGLRAYGYLVAASRPG